MSQVKPQSDERHWVDPREFVRKRWRLIAAAFFGFVAVAALLSVRQPPVYRATTRILVGSGLLGSALGDRSSALEGYFFERRSFETQLEIMRSEPVAERAALALGLLDAGTPASLRQAKVASLKGAVSVERVRETRVVGLSAMGPTPERARALADAMADAYIGYARDQRAEANSQSIAWLTSETANLREQLRHSEERLVDYLSTEHIDPSAEEEEGIVAPAGDGEALRSQIAAVEVELSQLRQRYRDRHPRVVDARARRDALVRRAERDRSLRGQENRKLIQYRILKRDADLDHQMYQVLLKKLKEADLGAELGEPDIRVLEAAKLPSSPVAPRTPRNLAVAAVLGLCLALGLAYGAEMLDRSVRSGDDVLRMLGLPTLGVVHRFDAPPGQALSAESPGSPEGETFRALRTNLRYSHVDKPRRVVLVTSTGAEEGKSTVLANLAVSLAQSGRRTLVVDTDLRRPSLHRLFRLPNGRGLADVLAGDADLDVSIQRTHLTDLDVLTCGTRPPNPAELIESVRLQERLGELRGRYEYVLLDSPPAGGLIDASLLSSLADGVVFVVEGGRFDLRLLRASLRQLERAGARLYGVVLNKASRDERAALYGYYRYGDLGEPSRGETGVSAAGVG